MNYQLIADLSLNHDGSFDKASELLNSISKAGLNSVLFEYIKYQEYNSSNPNLEIGDEIINFEIKKNFLEPSYIFRLMKLAKNLNLNVGICFYDMNDINDFDFIEEFDFFQIPSVEILNINLIKKLLKTNKNVIISTGGCTEKEIVHCINQINNYKNWIMLHNILNFPSLKKNSRLGYLHRLKILTNRDVGYLSNDLEWENCLLALAMGAKIIERRITLDKLSKGLYHETSSYIDELKNLNSFVEDFSLIKKGNESKKINQGEILNKQNFGKSLYFKNDFFADQILKREHLEEKRPQIGITNFEFDLYKNKSIKKNVKNGEVLKRNHFKKDFYINSDLRYFAIKNNLSLPVRLHDFEFIHKKFNIKNYEFHLSFLEVLNCSLDTKNYPNDISFSVHLPSYIDENNIFDPFSRNEYIRTKSNKILEKIYKFSSKLQHLSSRCVPIIGNFSFLDYEPLVFYEKCKKLLSLYREKDCLILPQWLPPFAWYFGGSKSLQVFNKKKDIELIKKFSIPICLDVSHFCMGFASNVLDIRDFEELIDLSAHIHLADSKGTDGEGIQIGKGDKKNKIILEKALNSSKVKVIEVWQGHLNECEGFYASFKKLSKLKNKLSS